MRKLIPGLKIRLYCHKNSTVFTVFGVTIFTDKNTNIISKIIAGRISPVTPQSARIQITKIGIINHIFRKLEYKQANYIKKREISKLFCIFPI